MKLRLLKKITLGLLLGTAGALALAGCDGKDGRDGAPGLNAGQGTVTLGNLDAEQQAAIAYQGEVTAVTISSPPVVRFKVRDGNGNPVTGLGSMDTTTTPPRLTT